MEKCCEKMNILIVSKKACTGCGICNIVCKKNAILFKEDDSGFQYPQVDSEKCINCSECVRKCPALKQENYPNMSIVRRFFCGYQINTELLLKSASGGAFACFSEALYDQGFLIYGVEYSSDYKKAIYSYANNKQDIERFKTSKYVLGEKGNVFKEIANQLAKGAKVFFTGLPCEIAALKMYLSDKDDKKLITCDLICHGPTSTKILREYGNYLETKFKSSIVDINMRFKKRGWTPPFFAVRFKNKKKYIKRLDETPIGFGVKNICRLSCSNCKYKGNNRYSDLTIGDYWGINFNDNMYNKNGVSVIVTNTKTGFELLTSINNFKYKEIDECEALRKNRAYYESAKIESIRGSFIKEWNEKGIMAANKRFNRQRKLYQYLLSLLPLHYRLKLKGFIYKYVLIKK